MKIKNGLKKCPRCKEKVLAHQKTCPFCGLIFDRLNDVSNKAAHKEVLKLRKRNYIMMSDWPADVSKKKALLLCGFLGLFGAHNIYLGRFYKAFFVLFGVICSVVLTIIDYATVWHDIIFYVSLVPAASVYVLWVLDFIRIFLERYKIPVAINKTETKKVNKIKINKNKQKNAENSINTGEKIDLENNLKNNKNEYKIEEKNNIKKDN